MTGVDLGCCRDEEEKILVASLFLGICFCCLFLFFFVVVDWLFVFVCFIALFVCFLRRLAPGHDILNSHKGSC